jgi:hypothetical protein
MRALAIALVALGGCHVVERNEILRPGASQRVRLPDPVAKAATVVLTDAGRLRFIEPLECKTEDVVAQVAGTELVTKPNLATFVVGIVATAMAASQDPRRERCGSRRVAVTYAGIGLIAPAARRRPVAQQSNRAIPGAERPAVRTRPERASGERAPARRQRCASAASKCTARSMPRACSVSPFQIVDALETVHPTGMSTRRSGSKRVTAMISGPVFAERAKAFLAKADFVTKIEPMRLVPGILPGTLRVSLTSTASGPAIRVVIPLKNDGPGPAWAVRGHVTAPSWPSIDGRVLYAGHLPKGDVREVAMLIPVSETAAGALRNAQVDIGLELRDAHGTAPATPIRFRGMILVDAPR